MKELTTRQKSTLLMVLTSFVPNIMIMILGVVKTRMIIQYLGSELNGVYQVMIHLSSFVLLANLGLDSAFRLTYYKYIENKDYEKATEIYNFSNIFFKKIVILMIVASLAISFISIVFIGDVVNWKEAVILQLLICLPNAISFYVGKEISLANARQRGYLYTGTFYTFYIIRYLVCIVIIKKTQTLYTFLFVELVLCAISYYIINNILKKDNNKVLTNTKTLNDEPTKISKHVLSYNLSKLIFTNTDTLVISWFLTKISVSVYTSYIYVATCLVTLIGFVINSFTNAMGSLLHSKDNYKGVVVGELFAIVEYILLVLVIPLSLGMESFVTKIWVNDNSYFIDNSLYFIICLYFAYFGFRLFVELIEDAGGYYKLTFKTNIAQAILNIFLSIVLVKVCGLIGVVLATILVLMFSQTSKMQIILNKLNIVKSTYIFNYILYGLIASLEIYICIILLDYIVVNNTIQWLTLMLMAGIISVVLNFIILFITNSLFRNTIKKYSIIIKERIIK